MMMVHRQESDDDSTRAGAPGGDQMMMVHGQAAGQAGSQDTRIPGGDQTRAG